MRPRQRAERPESELPSIGAVLAGWRLVRRLPGGAAERADFVAVCEAGAPGPAAASRHWQGFGAAAPEPLVHRRLAVAVGAAADGLVRECEARERLVGDFVERPEELLDDGGVRLALFEVRPVRGYAAIVADGGSLPAGACVTLLVPVAETVALAHGRGLAHGDLGLGVCGVDGRGRPHVDGWSTAVELEAVSAMRADLARAADLRGLGRVADALLAQSSEPPAPQLAAIVAALLEGTAPRDAPGRLIDALFAWCPAEPVPGAVLGALAGEQATAGADGGTGAAAVARRAEAPERGLGLLDDEPDDESEADRPGPRRGAAERRRERALEWRLRATALAGGV
ncbi:MAG: hypothetical protein GXX90_00030, partial [Microbacteriaceae bacterium]|nr:hypothetical protein [Microbacteriaceae bacterium]